MEEGDFAFGLLVTLTDKFIYLVREAFLPSWKNLLLWYSNVDSSPQLSTDPSRLQNQIWDSWDILPHERNNYQIVDFFIRRQPFSLVGWSIDQEMAPWKRMGEPGYLLASVGEWVLRLCEIAMLAWVHCGKPNLSLWEDTKDIPFIVVIKHTTVRRTPAHLRGFVIALILVIDLRIGDVIALVLVIEPWGCSIG